MRYLQKTTTAAAAIALSAFFAAGANAGHHGDSHDDAKHKMHDAKMDMKKQVKEMNKEGEASTGVYAPEKTDADPDNLNYTAPTTEPADAAKAIRKDSGTGMGDAEIDAKSNLPVEEMD